MINFDFPNILYKMYIFVENWMSVIYLGELATEIFWLAVIPVPQNPDQDIDLR